MIFPASVQLLHIPDGFLSLPISVVSWAITLVLLYFAVRNAQQVLDERLVPLAGIMAAFIFAGQMLNFPVAGGTSGHFIGATLAAIVLGPWVGLLAMTAVISLQALLFQDGGLVVMGANILIMGIVPTFVGYGLYQLLRNQSRGVMLVGTAVASWVSIEMAALITALLIGFSGTSAFNVAVPAMLGVHALVGIGEALITVAAISFIQRTRPQILAEGSVAGSGRWVVAGLVIALVVTLFAPLASASPDGLEWVAGEHGFLQTAKDAPYQILPDYTIPFLGESGFSTIVAGIVGVLLVMGITYLLGRLLQRHEPVTSNQ
ncbi:MAG: PDGLE domain-containing protein [Ardenticatenaceae bacterium]|nr:PDGLE domain-containing protein [Anaerolineales bacterium]MCB8923653.1 PDGLE domain-containing protein [Ardenticatenaceae bacterium]MCB8991872.1 PDGLE domain-containing protein [Ardenticatenaceae bacterium]MCB9005159.1 PDGLE domain-containing protein [Ardenticatenaceae bacterium]